MLNPFHLLYILFSFLFKLLKPGGVNSIIAENICLRQQLIILSRNKKRFPNLLNTDRLIFGFLSHYINPKRLARLAILIKPATLIKLHKLFVAKKHKSLFSKKRYKKPGRKGPTQEIIDLVLKYKVLNPRFGYLRIAMQVSNQFWIEISSDTVRRILDIEQIKSVPYTPISHPFVERLIKTIREELLNNILIWNSLDLQKKLDVYQDYFNQYRSHSAINAMAPENKNTGTKNVLSINNYKWKKYLQGLVQLPIAA